MWMKAGGRFLVLVGTTGSGKTDVGCQVARKLKGEVISADSISVYRQLNAGMLLDAS